MERDEEEVMMSGSLSATTTADFALEVPHLRSSMLHALIINPCSMLQYMIPGKDTEGAICIVEHLRRTMVWSSDPNSNSVRESLFQRMEFVLRNGCDYHIFWLFIVAMTIDASVLEMVASTFPGPRETFYEIFGYISNKLTDLEFSCYLPCTAEEMMRMFWDEIYVVVCFGNMKSIRKEALVRTEKISCPRTSAKRRTGGEQVVTGKRGRAKGSSAQGVIQRKREETQIGLNITETLNAFGLYGDQEAEEQEQVDDAIWQEYDDDDDAGEEEYDLDDVDVGILIS